MAEERDRSIGALAGRLEELKAHLGSGYWQDAEVQRLQWELRSAIKRYGAWSEDKPPLHQRARLAARYESDYAHLVWPGRDDD